MWRREDGTTENEWNLCSIYVQALCEAAGLIPETWEEDLEHVHKLVLRVEIAISVFKLSYSGTPFQKWTVSSSENGREASAIENFAVGFVPTGP